MVKVKVKYFGELRDLLDVKDEEYKVDDGTSLTDLILNHIPERHLDASEDWKKTVFRMVRGEIMLNSDGTPVLRDYVILIKGKSPVLAYKLRDGDEVAVLPPAGGG